MPIFELTGEELNERVDFDRGKWEDSIPEPDKVKAIQSYRDYAVGKQRIVLSEEMAAILCTTADGQNLSHAFADNICHPIISQAANRIIPTGYLVTPAQGNDAESVKAEQNFLTEDVFKKCNLSSLLGEAFYATFRDSNFALMPMWDEEKKALHISREDWWNGESGIFFAYDDEGNLLYAVKEWTQNLDKNTQVKRRTVYLDHEIQRYSSKNNGQQWERFLLESDGGQWPVPWVKRDGSPLHIPAVHFANAGRESGNYGLSELVGGIRGFQDHTNRLELAIVAAADLTAYQMYSMTNVNPPREKDNTIIPYKVGPGRIFMSLAPSNPDAPPLNTEMDVLPAGDMSQLLAALDKKIERAAHVTSTPLHVLTGSWPSSGEVIFRAERAAVDKAQRQVEKLKPTVERLGHRCTELFNTFGPGNLNEDAMITALFDSVEQLGTLKEAMADRELATSAEIWVRAGRPLADFLREKGWSDQRLEKLKQEQELAEKLAQEQDARMVDMLTREAEAAGNGNRRERVPA